MVHDGTADAHLGQRDSGGRRGPGSRRVPPGRGRGRRRRRDLRDRPRRGSGHPGRAGSRRHRHAAGVRPAQDPRDEIGQRSGEGGEQRHIEGTGRDRDVSVTLKPEGTGSTRIQVVAKASAVTWDKDFARQILDKIVVYSR